jgi:hypothetical protein
MFRHLAVVLLLALPGVAQSGNISAHDLVQKVVSNELKAEDQDHSHWTFRLDTQKPGQPEEVCKVIETRDGDLKYPIEINDHPASQQQRQQAEQQIQTYVHSPDQLRKTLSDKAEDEARSEHMLRMLPQAFFYERGQQQGDLVELKFKPNPQFEPPTHEARVFHAMDGSLWVDSKQLRLARISGRLMHEVKFGWGVLGHLDKGGTFDVRQEEVARGYWELTALNVQMNGKALFFKTISVRQKYTRSDFKPVPDSLTVAQAAQMLKKEVSGEMASALR